MASDASAVAPATPAATGGSTGIPGAAPGIVGNPIRAATVRERSFTLIPAASGAAGKPTAVTGRDFVGGATNAFGSGLGPAPGNGSASGSTTISG
jgi:hypothetical protein